jgi:hypothetical protein
MSIKSKIKDLLEEADGHYPSFYICKGFLYDSSDNELEGVVKVKICRKTHHPYIRVFVSKANEWIESSRIDVDRLEDPIERLKVLEVLEYVRIKLLT